MTNYDRNFVLNYIKETMSEQLDVFGITPEEMLSEYERIENEKKYYRVINGDFKGCVGYIYPPMKYVKQEIQDIFFPYTKILHLLDGSELMMNGWRWINDLEEISKEEYEEVKADE